MPRGGDPITIEFVASAAGEFPILCSEYCGDGHEDMKGMLVVVSKIIQSPSTQIIHSSNKQRTSTRESNRAYDHVADSVGIGLRRL